MPNFFVTNVMHNQTTVLNSCLNKRKIIMKKHVKLGLLLGLCAFNNTICFSNDSHLEKLKELYQYESWAGTTKTNYLRVIQNWSPNILTLGVTNLMDNPYIANDNNMRLGIYFFQPTNTTCNINFEFFIISTSVQ